MVTLKDLELELKADTQELKYGEYTIHVWSYIPVAEKTELLQYVVSSSLDEDTGCFSSLRVEIYFCLSIIRWYTDLDIEGFDDAGEVYDLLDSNGILSGVLNLIPEEELKFMQDLVTDTVTNIARYNSSAAGIINTINRNGEGIEQQIADIISKMEEPRTKELLSTIKDVG